MEPIGTITHYTGETTAGSCEKRGISILLADLFLRRIARRSRPATAGENLRMECWTLIAQRYHTAIQRTTSTYVSVSCTTTAIYGS